MTDQPTLQERLRNEWLAGFWAASLLFGGRYNDYAAKRDEMLAEKVEKNEQ